MIKKNNEFESWFCCQKQEDEHRLKELETARKKEERENKKTHQATSWTLQCLFRLFYLLAALPFPPLLEACRNNIAVTEKVLHDKRTTCCYKNTSLDSDVNKKQQPSLNISKVA